MDKLCRKCKNLGTETCGKCVSHSLLVYMYAEDCEFSDKCEDCDCCVRATEQFDAQDPN